MLQRELAPFGEPLRNALYPEGADSGEQARRSPGDGHVRHVSKVAVEASGDRIRIRSRSRDRRSLAPEVIRDLARLGIPAAAGSVDIGAGAYTEVLAAGEGPDHAECREVDADGTQPRLTKRGDKAAYRLAPCCYHDHVQHLLAVIPGQTVDDLPVQYRLVERHRNEILRLKPNRRLQLLLVLD